MTDTQHTPGPWRIEIENTGTTTICTDGDLIAELPVSDPENVNPANARLIASAPEMLAVLEKIEQAVANHDGGDFEAQYPEEVAAMRAAIAEATGRPD